MSRGKSRRRSLRRARRQDRAACAQPARRSPRSTARAPRLARLRQNLARLKLSAEIVEADAAQWQAGPFDAVLLDAPCSSTGTIRRHPDIPWLKSETDLAKLAALQPRLLDRAATLLKPGGTLVYCTCSLEPEEGEQQIAALLARNPALRRSPIAADEIAGHAEFLTADGRSAHPALPLARCPSPAMGGLDGFYAARITEIKHLAGLHRLAAVSRLRYMLTRGKAGRRRPRSRREASAFMAGLSIAERAKLSVLLGRRTLRSIAGRLRGHPFIRLSFIPRKADRLLIAPQDLRTADGTRASEIYSGRFAFAGKVVISDGRSPFEIAPPSEEWAASLLGFGWLRHLRAAESGITRANARALVDEWIALQGSWHPVGWQPEIMARRIISWLSQAPLILHDADDQFYRRFLRSLVRQVRYLRHTAIEARDGVPRMQALVALTYAALCMAGQARHMRGTIKQLVAEIERQILPDGGHISRNPGALIELLLDLLPLRQAFAARNIAPPPQLNNAIDRMMPMMRFFRHGDGNFAHFNGMGPTLARCDGDDPRL